jgi:hypothetical protein
MSQTFTITFNDEASYKKYKQEVLDGGGIIKHDYEKLLYFTAIISPTLVESVFTGNLNERGISSFDPESIATINT